MSLPQELIDDIVDRLHCQDGLSALKPLLSVSPSFNASVARYIFRSVKLSTPSTFDKFQDILRGSPSIPSFVRHLHITDLRRRNVTNGPSTIEVLKTLSHLDSLKFNKIKMENVPIEILNILYSLPITTLSLKNIKFDTYDSFYSIVSSFKTIKELITMDVVLLGGRSEESLPKSFGSPGASKPRLESLVLQGMICSVNTSLIGAILRCPTPTVFDKLTTLTMSKMAPLACQIIASTLATLERLHLIYYDNGWDFWPQVGHFELARLVGQVPFVSFVVVLKPLIQWPIRNDLYSVAELLESIPEGGHLARLRDVHIVLRISPDPEDSRSSWYSMEHAHIAGFRLTITIPSISTQRPLEHLEADLEVAKRMIDRFLVEGKAKKLAVRSVAAPDLCAMPLL